MSDTLAEVLIPTRIMLDSTASSKKRVFEQISELCAPASDLELFYQSLISREKLGSTALGEGVAIPHCRLPFLDKPVGCFIRLEKSIDFNAFDNQAVDLIFGLFVPVHATQAHLDILAQLAETFSQEALREQLRQAQTAAQIYDLFMLRDANAH